MKTTIAVLLILFTGTAFAQQQLGHPSDDLQKVKDVVVSQTVYVMALEKENIGLKNYLQRIADDLKAVKTLAQLDSLKKTYGIAVEEPKKAEEKKKAKEK